jgi:hypothetical protein
MHEGRAQTRAQIKLPAAFQRYSERSKYRNLHQAASMGFAMGLIGHNSQAFQTYELTAQSEPNFSPIFKALHISPTPRYVSATNMTNKYNEN